MTTQREADFLAAAYASGITSPKELANLMGQVSHPKISCQNFLPRMT